MVPSSSITDEEWDKILAEGGEIDEYDDKEDAVAAFAMMNEGADVASESEARAHQSSLQRAAPCDDYESNTPTSTSLPTSLPSSIGNMEGRSAADRAIVGASSSAPPGLTSPSSSANARYAGTGDPLGPTPLPGELAQSAHKIVANASDAAGTAAAGRPGSPAYTPLQTSRRTSLSSAPRRLATLSRLPARSTRSGSIRLGGGFALPSLKLLPRPRKRMPAKHRSSRAAILGPSCLSPPTKAPPSASRRPHLRFAGTNTRRRQQHGQMHR